MPKPNTPDTGKNVTVEVAVADARYVVGSVTCTVTGTVCSVPSIAG